MSKEARKHHVAQESRFDHVTQPEVQPEEPGPWRHDVPGVRIDPIPDSVKEAMNPPWQADSIVAERAKNYGHPKENFQNIAELWSGYLHSKFLGAPVVEVDFEAEDIPAMMILLKIARLMNGYHEDSVDDIAGYAKTWKMLHE